jgi:hypothetical protein
LEKIVEEEMKSNGWNRDVLLLIALKSSPATPFLEENIKKVISKPLERIQLLDDMSALLQFSSTEDRKAVVDDLRKGKIRFGKVTFKYTVLSAIAELDAYHRWNQEPKKDVSPSRKRSPSRGDSPSPKRAQKE